MTSLAVFGTGRIGGGVAARAASSGLIDHLVLYDSNENLLEAQELDIHHMRCQVSISIDKAELSDCDILLYTAGFPRNLAIKTRADLLESNLPAATDFISHLKNFSGICIVVSNPVDILTWYLWKKTGISRNRIIGFGGQLDSARLQCISLLHGISCDGIVLGEHGEHQVPIFSRSEGSVNYNTRDEIVQKLRGASMEIIKGKGATEYAPVFHIWSLIQSIITDSQTLLPCSAVLDGEFGFDNCSLGVPVTIGREGILSINEWELDEWERTSLRNAANHIGTLCRSIPNV